MTQFTLQVYPNAIHPEELQEVVNQFNALPNSQQFLNITGQHGNTITITDNPNSSVISDGNQAQVRTLEAYRAFDQNLNPKSPNAILFNPNPPDNKPLLNSLIHEIGHEKWPGLGNDATQHDPLFYALLNNALQALGVPVDPQQDLQGVDISGVVLPVAAVANPLSYNRPRSHTDLDQSEVQFASNDPGTWSNTYNGNTLTEIRVAGMRAHDQEKRTLLKLSPSQYFVGA